MKSVALCQQSLSKRCQRKQQQFTTTDDPTMEKVVVGAGKGETGQGGCRWVGYITHQIHYRSSKGLQNGRLKEMKKGK